MFRISNIDEKRTEWNLNETPVIIPLVDEDSLPKEPNKIVRTVNVIPEDEDQKSPTESLEHNFVISFDKNLFGQHSTKTDLLIIQDSDMKLFSCNPELKNQFGYSLSFVNQDKAEPLWSNPGLKDKPKEWSHDSAILEVKDILIFDEKANEKINLEPLESESKSFNSKSREDVQKEDIVEEEKIEKDFQLIINYIPECYTFSSKEKVGNCGTLSDSTKIDENDDNCKKTVNDSDHLRVSSKKFIDFKVDKNENKSEFAEVVQRNVILPEKSLPLKKKAKMKKTTVCLDNQRSLLKPELVKNRQLQENSFLKSKTEEPQSSFKQNYIGFNSEKLPLNKVSKRRKTQNTSQKLENEVTDLLVQGNKEEFVKSAKESIDSDTLGFDITKFKNIYDLVEGLRKYRMISVPIWQMLNTGLKEMNVDILKEIIKKRKEPENKNYSPQLKAFALVVYFKQPVAFNFLAKVCKDGWPSLNVIKEWKLQLNSHQRPNFVGVQRKVENVS